MMMILMGSLGNNASECTFTTSGMIHHLGASVNVQHTACLLICHGMSL